MPTTMTVIEASKDTITIFKWVVRSAVKNEELYIGVISRACSWAVVAGSTIQVCGEKNGVRVSVLEHPLLPSPRPINVVNALSVPRPLHRRLIGREFCCARGQTAQPASDASHRLEPGARVDFR